MIQLYHKGVPKQVDHEARRRQITDAVCRITARSGLGAATFREVAAEAGVSVRLVQYYFGNKAGLIEATRQHVGDRSIAKLSVWIERSDGSPRGVLEAFLKSFIPDDEQTRVAMLMYVAFAAETAVAMQAEDVQQRPKPPTEADMMRDMIVEQLERGPVAPGVVPEIEAAVITAMMPGLGNYLLDHTMTLDQTYASIDYHLDRLFIESEQMP